MQSDPDLSPESSIGDHAAPTGSATTSSHPAGYHEAVARFRDALQRSPDIIVLLVSVVALPVMMVVPIPLVRVPLGLAFVMFAPGYALVAALLPLRHETHWMVRLGLAFGLSISVIPLIALLFDLLSMPIRPAQIVTSLCIIVLFFSLIALWQRTGVVSGDPEIPSLGASLRQIVGDLMPSGSRAPLILAGMAGIVLLAALVLQLTQPSAPSNQFFITGSQGQARDYPRDVAAGQPVSVSIGIVNEENATRDYYVEIWSGQHGALLTETRLARVGPFAVEPQEVLERELSWEMPSPGIDRSVVFFLYRDGDVNPHRELRLTLDVSGFGTQNERGPARSTDSSR